MQLLPRYLVKNRIDIIANEAGTTITEYRPVYQREIQVYKGIDNVLEFRLLNTDQKPINTSLYTPRFMAFDENNNLVIEKDGAVLDDGSSATKGIFRVTVTENELLNIKQQFLKYNIFMVDNNSEKLLTYTDTHFGNDGTIRVNARTFPGPRATQTVDNFRQIVIEDVTYYVSDEVSAEPAINGNEALHTTAIYTDSFTGDVILQGTLDNQITQQGNNWFDIDTVTLDGTEVDPTIINFNGVFNFVRFKTQENPADKITKILLRN